MLPQCYGVFQTSGERADGGAGRRPHERRPVGQRGAWSLL